MRTENVRDMVFVDRFTTNLLGRHHPSTIHLYFHLSRTTATTTTTTSLSLSSCSVLRIGRIRHQPTRTSADFQVPASRPYPNDRYHRSHPHQYHSTGGHHASSASVSDSDSSRGNHRVTRGDPSVRERVSNVRKKKKKF
ncbi:hypothetical protein EX30DRAFT_54331 [Ascodesmis nigricans]|uniref:Uncharacterized protein n=1 Tax=Ascodesmis nigricans TaxID=341454 RepID=A0A4S2MVJ8_9PEZI|nr:hypothetical protein EX30DRAFT_54331 [Ascodesmis nigricans]